MASNNTANTGNSQASQNPVNLFSVYPAKVFHDLWKTSDQPTRAPNGDVYSYSVLQRTRIYDADGDSTNVDLSFSVPIELFQRGDMEISHGRSLRHSNEIALRTAHSIFVQLRDLFFQPSVKYEVEQNGCIHLRVNFGERSYFTIRVSRE